jgi:hypothetical protein
MILGFLDVRTLCTARLVCTRFRVAASRLIHSIKLSAPDLRTRPDTNFNSFPKLQRVFIRGELPEDCDLLALPGICDAVTHVEVFQRGVPAPLLPPLPNLVSLDVRACHIEQGFWHDSLFPITLQELKLNGAIPCADAERLTRLTRLTGLCICLPPDLHEPFEGVTALTTLRELVVCGPPTQIPYLGKLTLLTRLSFLMTSFDPGLSPDLDLAPLTCLQNLMHLMVCSPYPPEQLTRQHLPNIGAIASLKSLHVRLQEGPLLAALDAAYLAPLSRLTALSLRHADLGMDVPFLSRLNLEGLQSLELGSASRLGSEGLGILGRATGLTKLRLRFGRGAFTEPLELGSAFFRMAKLLALSLEACPLPASSCFGAMGLLTGLTSLTWSGAHVTNDDMDACLGLTQLRVLRITPTHPAPFHSRITYDTLVALAQLPELTTLEVSERFASHRAALMERIHALVKTQRHDKGWPPLNLDLKNLEPTVPMSFC